MKKPPPEGYTGRNGAVATDAQVEEWVRDRPDGNVALRMPPDVIGIDVDAYGGKVGVETLGRLEVQLGGLPPTAISSSRSDDVSGIRFFRVPPNRKWSDVGKDVQVIWWGHRYAVVWPSVHPEGRQYRWLDSDWRPIALGGVPRPAELAELPSEWVDYLGGETERRAAGGVANGGHASAFAGWSDNDGRRVDVEAILAGELGGYSTQREALIAVIRSGWAYGNPKPLLVRLGYEAIEHFPQTNPEWPWTTEDVDKLVESLTQVPPGKSGDVTGFELSDAHLAWARRAAGVTDSTPGVEQFDAELRRTTASEVIRLLARRGAEQHVTRGERVERTWRTASEFADAPAPEVIMREVLAAEVNLLGGPSEAGKSLVARDWALHVAAGETWRGRYAVERPRGVLWVASEGTHDFGERWKTQSLWERARERIFVLDDPVNLLDDADVTKLLAECVGRDLGLAVFDVVYGMGMTDDNGVKDVVPVINALKRISRELRAATLALGHNGHNGSRRFRGSSMWRQLAAVEHHMADGTFTCEKSKVGDKRRLAASYEVEYPGVRWLSSEQAVHGEVERRNRIDEELEAHPGESVLGLARRLAPLFNLSESRTRALVTERVRLRRAAVD